VLKRMLAYIWWLPCLSNKVMPGQYGPIRAVGPRAFSLACAGDAVPELLLKPYRLNFASAAIMRFASSRRVNSPAAVAPSTFRARQHQ
jgi:hypothetical protein